MVKEDKKLLKLCLSGLKDNNVDEKTFRNFSKNYNFYSKGQLTFRELLASIERPKGKLKDAMRSYYAGSVYHRTFKD